MRSQVHKIALSGLVALAAVLGVAAVPSVALAQPTAAVRPGSTARPAAVGEIDLGEPRISCLTAKNCLAIEGSSAASAGTATPTVVARWNGSAWQRLRVTLPKGTRADDLLGVSCKGAKSCLVVGDYFTSTSESAAGHVLALIYNGTSLKPTPTVPLPKGTSDVTLASVSCVTTRYCVALGEAAGDTSAFGKYGQLSLIETWNGAKWTLHTVAVSSGKTMVEPTALSCANTAFCVLTGNSITLTSNSGTSKLYAASWNGKKLTAMKPAAVSGSSSFLFPIDVSCATASNCAVTGIAEDISSSTPNEAAFTEIWNGKAWQLAKVAWPKAITTTFMDGVSCYGAHSCESVGIDSVDPVTSSTGTADAVAVSYNGTAGTLQAVPAPSKGYSNEFADVSCLPWGSCVAVGETGKSTTKTPALMTGVWNGKAWKLAPGF